MIRIFVISGQLVCMLPGMRFFLGIATTLLICAESAHAQVSGSWTGPSVGTWTNGANWSSNPQFPSNNGAATLSLPHAGLLDVRLNTAVTLEHLSFPGPAIARISAAGGSPMFGPNGTVDAQASAASGTTLALEPAIPATGSAFTKTGSGTLSIIGTQTASVRVTGGTLRVGAGTGTIELDGGVLLNPNSRPVVLGANGGVWRDTSQSSIFRTVPISGDGALTLSADNLSFSNRSLFLRNYLN